MSAVRLVLSGLVLGLAVACGLAACKSRGDEGEVSRSQCVDIIRKQDRLRAEDTGGLHTAVRRTERARIDRCVKTATEEAYRCIQIADTAQKLEICETLFR